MILDESASAICTVGASTGAFYCKGRSIRVHGSGGSVPLTPRKCPVHDLVVLFSVKEGWGQLLSFIPGRLMFLGNGGEEVHHCLDFSENGALLLRFSDTLGRMEIIEKSNNNKCLCGCG